MTIHPNEVRRPQPPKPSAPAKLEITFGFEPPLRFFAEARRLIAANIVEAFPGEDVDPDFARCNAFIAAGVLHVWTARCDGVLIGYTVWLTVPSAYFCSEPWAFCEMYYLDKKFRNGWTAYRMFKGALDALKVAGVRKAQVRWRDPRFGKFFTRLLKFKEIETIGEREL